MASGAVLICMLCACSSDKDAAESAEGASDASATAAPSPASEAAGATVRDELSVWMETAPVRPSAVAYNHAFVLPPAAAVIDPDAAIERYANECPQGATSEACHDLKLVVESAFLESFVEVRRTDEPLDPEWIRIAAAAENGQLACLGIGELIFLPGRTAEDEALILSSLDHPAPSVRAVVLGNASKIPGIEGLFKRSSGFGRNAAPACVDGTVDYVPGPKWAGNYPGARYRPFASSMARRWFTTSDPVEKVIAYFAARGKPARTREELAADAAAKFTEESARISPDDPNGAEKLMELMQNMGGGQDWSASFRDLQDTGPIKYIRLSPAQAIAVFHDEVLKATSIVAPRPAPKVDLTPDMDKEMRMAKMRSILGY